MPTVSPEDQLIAAIPSPSAPILHSPQSYLSDLDATVMHARLPVEVCERIIDALGVEHTSKHGYDNVKTLLACSLTSREWFHRARRYLYTMVSLYVNRIDSFGGDHHRSR